MVERRVGFDLGELDNLRHGLGEFATQLLRRVAVRAGEWQALHGVSFDVQIVPRLEGAFGPAFRYLPAGKAQRRVSASSERYAVWHTLHQLSRQQPPAQAALRLVTVHDLIFLDQGSFVSRWRHRRRTQALLARSDALVAISDWTAADVRRRLRWTGPLTTIHNGARDLTGQALEPLPGVAAERPFLMHLSRLAPSKNPQAMLDLAAHWPQMTFVLCAVKSDHSLAVAALAQRRALGNVKMHFDITDAQKAWAFRHCAGFVFPSLAEGFGLPPVEAMFFGKPVFLSRLTSLPEVGGDAAWYFDSFAPEAMRAVVEQGMREAASDERRERIRAHAAAFNWDRCCDAYLAFYLSVLDR